jgi:hypothetical protein
VHSKLPDLGFAPLKPPEDPDDAANPMQIKLWEIAYKAFSKALDRRGKANSQAFVIVLGQCSPTIVDCLKAKNK